MGGRRRGARRGRLGPRALLEGILLEEAGCVRCCLRTRSEDGMPPVVGVMSVNDTFLAGVVFSCQSVHQVHTSTCSCAHNQSRRLGPFVNLSMGETFITACLLAPPPVQPFPLPEFEVLLGHYVFSSNPYTRQCDACFTKYPVTEICRPFRPSLFCVPANATHWIP